MPGLEAIPLSFLFLQSQTLPQPSVRTPRTQEEADVLSRVCVCVCALGTSACRRARALWGWHRGKPPAWQAEASSLYLLVWRSGCGDDGAQSGSLRGITAAAFFPVPANPFFPSSPLPPAPFLRPPPVDQGTGQTSLHLSFDVDINPVALPS